jgi:hypothetical protein
MMLTRSQIRAASRGQAPARAPAAPARSRVAVWASSASSGAANGLPADAAAAGAGVARRPLLGALAAGALLVSQRCGPRRARAAGALSNPVLAAAAALAAADCAPRLRRLCGREPPGPTPTPRPQRLRLRACHLPEGLPGHGAGRREAGPHRAGAVRCAACSRAACGRSNGAGPSPPAAVLGTAPRPSSARAAAGLPLRHHRPTAAALPRAPQTTPPRPPPTLLSWRRAPRVTATRAPSSTASSPTSCGLRGGWGGCWN